MNKENQKILCPHCGNEIDVNEALYKQLSVEMDVEFNKRVDEKQKEFEKKLNELKKEKESIEKQKTEMLEAIDNGVKEKMSVEKLNLEKKLRNQLEEEKSDEIKSYQDQLQQKTEEAREYNKTKAELSRVNREKDELHDKLLAESEEKLNIKLEEEKGKIRKTMENSIELKLNDKQRIIDQLSEQLKEAQRKAEQGSMQSQGEVQELAIEDWLKTNFPLDEINEIKKGERGADCLQIINTRTGSNCGSIYYESKRTKDFSKIWIEKFKADMRNKKAVFGVLVTDAMPKEMDRMGQKDGIWICTYEDFKALCFVLRESVILLYTASQNQENKGDKMSLLYTYLTGSEFRMQVEAIVEGFTQMHTDLMSEKRSMEGIWKKREKQIEKVLLNTNHMYGSIRGIAGNAVGAIKALELPEPEDE